MMLPDNTRIAGQKTVANWKAMRARLDGCKEAKVWKEAFNDYFEARLDSRYFMPIEALQTVQKYDGEGFAIVTIHCSLIEFLASTVEGLTYRHVPDDSKKEELGEFEYSSSSQLFVRFLRQQNPFKDMFSSNNKANDFYANVRCGLLHEARTKGGWRIRADGEVAIDTNRKVIDRNKLQDAFRQFIESYGKQITHDAKLQPAFIRKFDALCEA